MKISSRNTLFVGVSGLVLATPTFAQTTPAASDALEEIVVTAQRRSESLERTPVAIAVLSGETLAKQAIVSESDLRTAVPGLTVRSTLNSNDLTYSIRGQTVDSFSGSNPAVLPYVNEVQVSGGGGASAFYDLQSIQVLKGPQGTLFGRNATGGAVLFTTAKPTNKFEGFITVRGGNYDSRQLEGAVNIPVVSDTVLARVAGFYQKRNGFQYNTITDSTVGDVDRYGMRGSLTVKFSEGINNDLVVDYSHSGGSSASLVLSAVAPQFSNNAVIPANLLYTPFLDTAIGFPGAWAAYTAANPKFPAGGIFDALAQQNARGPFTVSVNSTLAHKANNLIISDIFTADITDNLQFKNVLGYTNIRTSDNVDVDGSAFGIDGCLDNQPCMFHKVEQYSEEPQLLGKAFSGNLSYIAGAYYANEKSTAVQHSYFASLLPLAPPASQFNDTLIRDKTYAGYLHGVYDLSGVTGITGFSASAGARYTSEKIRIEQLPTSVFYFNPPVAPFNNELSKTFNKVSWQFGLQDQLNSQAMVYAVTRRSFRSGGFNALTPPVAGTGNSGGSQFEPEVATDVELGFKYQGNLVSMPVRLNVAAYNQWIEDIQRVVFAVVAGAPASVTVNVPKTRVRGVELDGQINPTLWLKLGGSANYTDSKFTGNQVTIPGTPPATVGFGPPSDTPRWSGGVFSEVVVPVAASLELSLRGDVYYQSKNYYSSTNDTITPQSEIGSYAVSNFRIGLEDTNAGWAAALVLKNAFNRIYYVGGLGVMNTWAANAVIPGDPRTFVGEVRYKF